MSTIAQGGVDGIFLLAWMDVSPSSPFPAALVGSLGSLLPLLRIIPLPTAGDTLLNL